MRWGVLLLLLGLVFAWQHQSGLKRAWQQGAASLGLAAAAPAEQAGAVKVYTIDACAEMCGELLAFFRSAGVSYTEYNLDRDENSLERMRYLARGLPRIVDQDREMVGYDPDLLRQWYVERPRNVLRLEQLGITAPGATGETILFATSWCGYCAQARAYFAAHGIPYRELDIEKNLQAAAWQQTLVGNSGVPTIIYANMIRQGFSAQAMDTLREWADDA